MLGYILAIVFTSLVVASGKDAHLSHHVFNFQLIEPHVIVLVVVCFGEQLVGVFPLVKSHHSGNGQQHGRHVHAVLPVEGVGQGKQVLGHLCIRLAFLTAGIHVEYVAERELGGPVFLHLKQVEAVVGDTAHFHGNTVQERE